MDDVELSLRIERAFRAVCFEAPFAILSGGDVRLPIIEAAESLVVPPTFLDRCAVAALAEPMITARVVDLEGEPASSVQIESAHHAAVLCIRQYDALSQMMRVGAMEKTPPGQPAMLSVLLDLLRSPFYVDGSAEQLTILNRLRRERAALGATRAESTVDGQPGGDGSVGTPEQTFTVAEVAEKVGVTERAVQIQLRKKYPGCKVGGQWRVPASILRQLHFDGDRSSHRRGRGVGRKIRPAKARDWECPLCGFDPPPAVNPASIGQCPKCNRSVTWREKSRRSAGLA